ncbi:high choriolytic enzyme 2-like [Argonauta hians]
MDTTSYKGKRCIRFVKQSKERSYIKFVNGKGCKADVGYKGKKSKKTKVYLGKRCWERGMILHEVLHALGFRHEHGRHDRDRYVRINATNIIKKQKYNFRKHKPSQTTSLGLPYDYLSIMHYGKKYFAIDHKYPTVIPKKRGVYIGQRKGMSQLDIKKLQRLFGCKERKLVHKSNLYIQPPNCNFEFGLCRWKHRGILSKKNKRWYRLRAIKAARVKGPITDHTYGTFEGSYLFTKSTKRIHTNSRIQTPALSFGRYILSFWFQIKGKRLRFKIFKIDERGTYHLLFSKPKYTGVQGKWINIKRRVFSAGKTKIQFTAKFRSFISPSFVALDDVTFKRR